MIREYHFTTAEVAQILARHVSPLLGVPNGALVHFKSTFRIQVDESGEASVKPGRLVKVERVSLVLSEDATELEARFPEGVVLP